MCRCVATVPGVPHPLEHTGAADPLQPGEAERLAEWMTAFTAGSRLRLLYGLVDQERSVDDLAGVAGLSPTVASQQLRVLRQLGVVAVRREGRRAFYRLGDHHVVDLLAAIRASGEHRAASPSHLAAPVAEPAATPAAAPQRTGR
jgi:DNA-binding transcriptional ArsR family regulator